MDDKLKERISKTAAIIGHDYYGGGDVNSVESNAIRKNLLAVIEKLIKQENIQYFIMSGDLGAAQIGFWCVYTLKKKYPGIKSIIALPYRQQPDEWTLEQKKWYKTMLIKADKIIEVDTLEKYSKENSPVGKPGKHKIILNDEYIVDNSNVVLSLYSEKKDHIKDCIKYAYSNNKKVCAFNPEKNFSSYIPYKNQ